VVVPRFSVSVLASVRPPVTPSSSVLIPFTASLNVVVEVVTPSIASARGLADPTIPSSAFLACSATLTTSPVSVLNSVMPPVAASTPAPKLVKVSDNESTEEEAESALPVADSALSLKEFIEDAAGSILPPKSANAPPSEDIEVSAVCALESISSSAPFAPEADDSTSPNVLFNEPAELSTSSKSEAKPDVLLLTSDSDEATLSMLLATLSAVLDRESMELWSSEKSPDRPDKSPWSSDKDEPSESMSLLIESIFELAPSISLMKDWKSLVASVTPSTFNDNRYSPSAKPENAVKQVVKSKLENYQVMGLKAEGLDDVKRTLEALTNQLPDAVKDAVDESLSEGMFHSVGIVHVITGKLRDSIRTENVSSEGGDLVAGGEGGVNYADIEELGNSRREGHPYLRPGFEVATNSVLDNVKKEIDRLL
jgi:hypothetical protein